MVQWAGEWYHRKKGASWRNRRTGQVATGAGNPSKITSRSPEVTLKHRYYDDNYNSKVAAARKDYARKTTHLPRKVQSVSG